MMNAESTMNSLTLSKTRVHSDCRARVGQQTYLQVESWTQCLLNTQDLSSRARVMHA